MSTWIAGLDPTERLINKLNAILKAAQEVVQWNTRRRTFAKPPCQPEEADDSIDVVAIPDASRKRNAVKDEHDSNDDVVAKRRYLPVIYLKPGAQAYAAAPLSAVVAASL